jgi:hypothetical protein
VVLSCHQSSPSIRDSLFEPQSSSLSQSHTGTNRSQAENRQAQRLVAHLRLFHDSSNVGAALVGKLVCTATGNIEI